MSRPPTVEYKLKPSRATDEVLLASVRKLVCVVCSKYGVDAHHVRSRGAGGPDAPWNVAPLCRLHHQRFHSLGLNRFTEKFPVFRLWLTGRGWTHDFNDGWQHAGERNF